MKKLAYLFFFILGISFTIVLIFFYNVNNETSLQLEFIEKAANRYKRGDNHFNGDDYYQEYYDMSLTNLDFNILAYILDIKTNDEVYVYIDHNSKNTKKIWYVKSVNVHGSRADGENNTYYEKFDIKTFKFDDVSRNEFEKHENPDLQMYSSYGMD
ncbi:hypothetical protein I6N95_09495 [Vagococcus sp. BWB3-3]|uniref:DUF3139 domain-containing protein n=1 Tax=Vagococcus allomyrinae TaxID=2794353 RepID=A0A940P473_9ENTE|nr:hypothetical protein [Vagococcus allomyrinae]MBP1041239.1 hypothetical protein [Vagococcus allomyrinae]